MLHQDKRVSKFDKFIKDVRTDIPKVGVLNKETSTAISSVPVDIVETAQPKGVDEDFDYETDYSALAKQLL